MLLQDGKWKPHSRYDVNALGSALMKAKELDNDTEYDGVKVMKISTGQSGQKDQEIERAHEGANTQTEAVTRAGLAACAQPLRALLVQVLKGVL